MKYETRFTLSKLFGVFCGVSALSGILFLAIFPYDLTGLMLRIGLVLLISVCFFEVFAFTKGMYQHHRYNPANFKFSFKISPQTTNYTKEAFHDYIFANNHIVFVLSFSFFITGLILIGITLLALVVDPPTIIFKLICSFWAIYLIALYILDVRHTLKLSKRDF